MLMILSVSFLTLCVAVPADGRRFSLSTNVIDYLNLGTLNLEASYGFSRHWSMNMGVRYNPFTFRHPADGTPMQNRKQSYELGARFWPWHVFSGWWVAAKGKYQEYNYGGVFSPETEEGDGYGIGFSAGYSYMLHPNLNLEFGLGFWTGVRKYTVYDCPACGQVTESGTRGFILPNELLLSLVYVF